MLSIKNLAVEFSVTTGSKKQQVLKAVNNVSLQIKQGETVAIVGESGSGKSQLFNALMGLLPKNAKVSGEIEFIGQSLLDLELKQLNQIRGKEIGMIFQDPMTALNPYLRIGKQLTEVLEVHQSLMKFRWIKMRSKQKQSICWSGFISITLSNALIAIRMNSPAECASVW